MQVLLLTGYKNSGKDTFFTNRFSLNEKYIILGRDKNTTFPEIKETSVRLSWAENVRKLVALDYPQFNGLNYDQCKDDPKYAIDGKTWRDIINEYTHRYPKSHWVDISMDEIYNNEQTIITDFRYPEMYTRLCTFIDPSKIISCRIFRDVPIGTDENEHFLDNFTTDFILLTDSNDIPKLIQLFPQYSNFKKITFAE